MKNKVLGLLLCGTMLMCSLAGCGTKATTTTPAADTNKTTTTESKSEATATTTEEKVVLSIYAQYADDDTKVPYDYAVEKLAEAYPNVELNLIIQAQDDGTTLETLAATGQLPDIFQANTNIINTFRETDQVMVLDEVAK